MIMLASKQNRIHCRSSERVWVSVDMPFLIFFFSPAFRLEWVLFGAFTNFYWLTFIGIHVWISSLPPSLPPS